MLFPRVGLRHLSGPGLHRLSSFPSLGDNGLIRVGPLAPAGGAVSGQAERWPHRTGDTTEPMQPGGGPAQGSGLRVPSFGFQAPYPAQLAPVDVFQIRASLGPQW